MRRFEGKVAIVTGAGGRKNMGRASAFRLASEGAKVVLTDLPAERVAAEVGNMAPPSSWKGIFSNAEEIQRNGGVAKAITADLGARSDLEKLVNETLKSFGKVDILVNCAAVRQRRWGERLMMTETPEDEMDVALRINFYAPWLLSKLVVADLV
ncbi:MAG: SDR family NAD(P)-dependent oxidoreductase [Chloroflexi bacterium]|nr:SDR family NAD(P)-dependent oxidoreductase [Chloroflexota bacterium]